MQFLAIRMFSRLHRIRPVRIPEGYQTGILPRPLYGSCMSGRAYILLQGIRTGRIVLVQRTEAAGMICIKKGLITQRSLAESGHKLFYSAVKI